MGSVLVMVIWGAMLVLDLATGVCNLLQQQTAALWEIQGFDETIGAYTSDDLGRRRRTLRSLSEVH